MYIATYILPSKAGHTPKPNIGGGGDICTKCREIPQKSHAKGYGFKCILGDSNEELGAMAQHTTLLSNIELNTNDVN